MVMNSKNRATRQINYWISFGWALIALTLHINALASSDLTYADISEGTEITSIVENNPFKAFAAEFKAYRFGRELGTANLALSKLEDNQYRLDYSSRVSIFFLSDKRRETSYFEVEDNKIIPLSYVFKRTGTGSDKQTKVEFDHVKGKIIVNDRPSFPLEGQLDNQLYRLDLQAKLALGKTTFDYQVINDRGQFREYKMQVLGTESLSLPFGDLDAIKVEIVRENSTRNTFAWFSPALNYQLVRLQQFKDGEEQGDIKLSKYSTTTT